MFQEQLSALIVSLEFPDDQCVQCKHAVSGTAFPRIRKLFKGNDLQYFAMADPVKIKTGYRVCSELKVMSHNRLEIIFHEPLLQQLGFRQVFPNNLFRMTEEKPVFNSL